MKSMIKNKLGLKQGQGMSEYVIIIALVAIAAIVVVGLFGKDIKGGFQRIGSAISGTEVAGTPAIEAGEVKGAGMEEFEKGSAAGK
ncbi:MAG: pilus assembly protein Flp/PilA [Verrucomicrobiales bacterium]|jgi:pilus assembly protein Flp/PilA